MLFAHCVITVLSTVANLCVRQHGVDVGPGEDGQQAGAGRGVVAEIDDANAVLAQRIVLPDFQERRRGGPGDRLALPLRPGEMVVAISLAHRWLRRTRRPWHAHRRRG